MRQFFIVALTIGLTAATRYDYHYAYHGPPAPLSADGKVIETDEVASARAAHLAAYEAAVARAAHHRHHHHGWPSEDEHHHEESQELDNEEPMKKVYHGPLAPLGKDGRVIETEEVARAKAAHLAVHAQAVASSAPYDSSSAHEVIWANDNDNHLDVAPANVAYTTYHMPVLYHGPPAPLAKDGRVINTPEVAQARDDHLRAYAHAASIAATHHDHDNCLH